MKLPVPKKKAAPENTITLINVVFLMLIFFLVAGSLTPPIDREVSMISTSEAERTAPADTLAIRADGSLWFRGQPTTLETWAAEHASAGSETAEDRPKLLVDRALPAADLIQIASGLRSLGVETVTVMTERAAP
ncbi:biopolymer transporter ExbD [Rhizobium sp. EC-SD404]|uniref:ExbD/TolR family protein n=1 Tax=Rhizobium sp. EC-SD404 TaxID=2038389 RepID=UPI00125138ED|nr:biopolymer transporter ExbD [Rhizobium sp. EC-SD404]VVT15322.1 Biopolymer transport protein ExbD/TolR [Rhizobium sp. EC-SD404]